MEYPKPEREFLIEFIKRSKEVCEAGRKTPFGTTALINCALGMFIIPREREKNLGTITDSLFNKFSTIEKEYTYQETFDKDQLMRHMRNSLAHGNICLISENKEIHSIVLWDKSKRNEIFKMEIPVDLFYEFVHEYAESVENNGLLRNPNSL